MKNKDQKVNDRDAGWFNPNFRSCRVSKKESDVPPTRIERAIFALQVRRLTTWPRRLNWCWWLIVKIYVICFSEKHLVYILYVIFCYCGFVLSGPPSSATGRVLSCVAAEPLDVPISEINLTTSHLSCKYTKYVAIKWESNSIHPCAS